MDKYLDTSLSPAERAEDLLSKMTMEEKIAQLACYQADKISPDYDEIKEYSCGTLVFVKRDTPQETAEISDKMQKAVIEGNRFGIPAFIDVEAVAGGMFGGATSYPTALSQASTWDPELIQEMADEIREQLIAVGYRKALSSVFDIGRDPRWGRLTETYGEDETLSAAMAVAFVKGLQGDGGNNAVAATGKHFVGHGVTEGGLNMGQNPLGERDLREVHCKPFQAAITEADLMSVMNSYCAWNHEAIIASKKVLTDMLRDDLGFKGVLVSDYLSIEKLMNPYMVADNHLDAGILALKAGLDVENPMPANLNNDLIKAVEDGRLDPALIDRSARRVLELKFRLGLFEHPYAATETIDEVFSNERNEKTCRKIADELITLLKNNNNTLPLDKKVRKIAVVGPHANRVRSLSGHYNYAGWIDMGEDAINNAIAGIPERAAMPDNSIPCGAMTFYQRFPGDIRDTPAYVEKMIRDAFPKSKTIFEAVRDYLPDTEVVTVQGINFSGNDISDYDLAIDAAADADVVILTLGGQDGWGVTSTNGEGTDNSNIDLPGKQEQFARDIYALGKKTIVVHIDGKPLCNSFVISHFDALIEAWQVGEFGAEELVKILFGEISPSGKLPVTVANGADTLPVYYGLPRGSGWVGAGRFGIMNNKYGYINKDCNPHFYFGHGLSYSKFEYSNLQFAQKEVGPEDDVVFCVDVQNVGDMDSDVVVEAFYSDKLCSMVRPEQQLAGFKRVSLKKGEKKTVKFTMKASQTAFLDIDMKWKVEAGDFEIQIGSSCADIHLKDCFKVTEDAFVEQRTRGFYAKAEVL